MKAAIANQRFCVMKYLLMSVTAIVLGGFFVSDAHAVNMSTTLNVVNSPVNATYYNAIVKTANRLVTLQNSNGSWDWVVTGATGPSAATYLNVSGVTAEGLLSAYKVTGDQAYLEAAKKSGDYIITNIDSSSPKNINAYNVLFLQKLSAESGVASYATKAAEYFQAIYSAPSTMCASGCLDAAGLLAGDKIKRGAVTTPDGIVMWDLVPYVEYATLVNDTVHATEIANAIIAEATSTAFVSTVNNYDLGLAASLKAAKLINDDASVATFSNNLVADTAAGYLGSYGKVTDGKVQVTSYALRSLKLISDSRASDAASYLASTSVFITTGGWLDTDSNEYAEIDSEAVTALASMLPQVVQYYTIHDALIVAHDGDTIKIAPGDYNLVKDDVTMVSGQAGWYMAVTKNNLTFVGVDASGNEITQASDVAANIYSTQETPNGSWASQNLITVFGDNVTFKGLGIMNKIEPNKAIEVLGNNFRAEACQFNPISKALYANVDNYNGDDISKYGSGVYFNNNRATSSRTATVINNIFNNSGVTFDSFLDNWTVDISHNLFDGNKVWSWTDKDGFHSQYYSAIGATTWDNQPDFTGSALNIHDNKFMNMIDGQILLKIKNEMTGAFNATENYWGVVTGPTASSTLGNVVYNPWYIDEPMTTLSNVATLTAFSIYNQSGATELNETNKTIKITMPSGTNVGTLLASFSFSGASVKVGTTTQSSGVTVNDFSGPVTYTVVAGDSTTQDYVVTVKVTPLDPGGSVGGGGGSYTPQTCSSVVYGEWGNCAGGTQYRDITSQIPSSCSLTAEQQVARSRTCGQANNDNGNNGVNNGENNGQKNGQGNGQQNVGGQQVLGVQKYAVGTLFRSKLNGKIHVVVSENTLKYVSSLKELAKYKGKVIISVDESVIASYNQVLGSQKYTNGTLVRSKGDKKVFVIINGVKVHIRSLAELAKYAGQPIMQIE